MNLKVKFQDKKKKDQKKKKDTDFRFWNQNQYYFQSGLEDVAEIGTSILKWLFL